MKEFDKFDIFIFIISTLTDLFGFFIFFTVLFAILIHNGETSTVHWVGGTEFNQLMFLFGCGGGPLICINLSIALFICEYIQKRNRGKNEKIIQISSIGVINNSQTQCNHIITALYDDGTIWQKEIFLKIGNVYNL